MNKKINKIRKKLKKVKLNKYGIFKQIQFNCSRIQYFDTRPRVPVLIKKNDDLWELFFKDIVQQYPFIKNFKGKFDNAWFGKIIQLNILNDYPVDIFFDIKNNRLVSDVKDYHDMACLMTNIKERELFDFLSSFNNLLLNTPLYQKLRYQSFRYKMPPRKTP